MANMHGSVKFESMLSSFPSGERESASQWVDDFLGSTPVAASAQRRAVSSAVSKIQSDYLKGEVLGVDAINQLVDSGMSPEDARSMVSRWEDDNPVDDPSLDIIVGRKL